ncbi:MAG: GDSL-type esterase/lipase family protein [Bacteroidia bacterium]|jgi:acyl-CoA thioesterase-1|nr:GDSL-type esterase/lipase family protein [Bacteroidia bacterium]
MRYGLFTLLVCLCLAGCRHEPKSPEQPRSRILFVGGSITSGHGVALREAYPSLIQHYLDSLQKPYEVVNLALPGSTVSAILMRLSSYLHEPASIIVLELGLDDLRAGGDPVAVRQQAQKIIDKIRSRYPEAVVILAGVQPVSPEQPAYVSAHGIMCRELAVTNHTALIHNMFAGITADTLYWNSETYLPSPAGHDRIARTVWKELQNFL